MRKDFAPLFSNLGVKAGVTPAQAEAVVHALAEELRQSLMRDYAATIPRFGRFMVSEKRDHYPHIRFTASEGLEKLLRDVLRQRAVEVLGPAAKVGS